MKNVSNRTIISYVVRLFIILLLAYLIMLLFIDEVILLTAVFLGMFILTSLLIMRIHKNYIEPIKEATETLKEIRKGNYQARFHFTRNPLIRNLSVHMNKMARDLTEFSLQEEIQSEQLSTLIDNTESGLILIDERGYIHLVNRKFLAIFGQKEKDYVGSLYYDALENDTIQETIQKVFLYESKVKNSFKQPVGIDEMYFEISAAPIIDERNLLKGAVLVLHDITELKKLEGMRKDFVANVSHELRTPVTSIKGFSETLLDGDIHDTEAVKTFLEIIYKESDRIQNLIEDLLALSKLESDNYQLVLQKIRTIDLVEELKPSLDYKAGQKNITFTTNIEDHEFKADKERITQVIINLLDNAMNYTPEQGEVVLHIYKEQNWIHLEVSDTGIGIPEKEIARIFQRFYRIDKARARDSGGTGLGLAIVKHIIEGHDGEIVVDSELDQGTTIRASIPYIDGR